jgi:hypothetical protein
VDSTGRRNTSLITKCCDDRLNPPTLRGLFHARSPIQSPLRPNGILPETRKKGAEESPPDLPGVDVSPLGYLSYQLKSIWSLLHVAGKLVVFRLSGAIDTYFQPVEFRL